MFDNDADGTLSGGGGSDTIFGGDGKGNIAWRRR
jgi:hypothetical protein